MDKPVSIFAAYRQICENANKAAAQRKVLKSRQFDIDGDKSEKTEIGMGGRATDRFVRTDVEKHPNSKYSEKVLVSPFSDNKSTTCTPKCGLFSNDYTTVCAALSRGISTNHPVQSRLIPTAFDNDANANIPENAIDFGLVDALTWQCLMGNEQNVREILKAGYKAMKRYSGLTPITAAIRGRNLQVLKLVLSVPKIRELVNSKDGFGARPIQGVAEIPGIDPYEFAREIVNAGGIDCGYRGGQYSAAMLCLLRHGGGAIWTPNIFAEILPVTDLSYKAKDGETLETLAKRIGNLDATRMIENFKKFGLESLNPAILDNGIAF